MRSVAPLAQTPRLSNFKSLGGSEFAVAYSKVNFFFFPCRNKCKKVKVNEENSEFEVPWKNNPVLLAIHLNEKGKPVPLTF